MGKALETVIRFYDLTNNKNQTDGLEKLLSENMSFTGPLMQASGADKYIEMLKPLIKFHKSWKMIKQFENGNDVCSIYELTLGTPAGRDFSVTIADWIRVVDGRVAEQKIYYDPREYAKAFGMG
jgi:ketosteroid isomerase-like protein